MAAKPYSAEEDAKILVMRGAGLSFKAIARDMGRGRDGVASRYCKLIGRAPVGMWSEAEDVRLRELCVSGDCFKTIAQHMPGRSWHACAHRARFLKIGKAPNNPNKGITYGDYEQRLHADDAKQGSANLLRALNRYFANRERAIFWGRAA